MYTYEKNGIVEFNIEVVAQFISGSIGRTYIKSCGNDEYIKAEV